MSGRIPYSETPQHGAAALNPARFLWLSALEPSPRRRRA